MLVGASELFDRNSCKAEYRSNQCRIEIFCNFNELPVTNLNDLAIPVIVGASIDRLGGS